jgi:hypothetical protein
VINALLVALSVSSVSFYLVGYITGRYVERVEWNRIIRRGKKDG